MLIKGSVYCKYLKGARFPCTPLLLLVAGGCKTGGAGTLKSAEKLSMPVVVLERKGYTLR
jgi:hypothetical protein